MKRIFSLFVLTLAIIACACFSAIAGDAENSEVFYYGDYAYMLADGQATIVDSSGGNCGPSWDDEEEGFDRPGTEDASACRPKSADEDGVWRIVIPATIDGHPVIAIGDGGLGMGVWGDVVLPEGLTSIGEYAFNMCTEAFAITIPASVTFIGETAFMICPATLRVTEGSYAAQYAEDNGIPYTYDTEYTVFTSGDWLYALTGGMATIYGFEHEYDYDDDWNIIDDPIDLVFPEQLDGYPVAPVKSLPLRYFSADYLNSITIPASVTEMAGNPFARMGDNPVSGCIVAEFIVSPDNPIYEAVDGVLFEKQHNMLVAWPRSREGDYAVPEGTAAIGDEAFYLCGGLTGVTIPDSVTHIGDRAFYYCKGLTSVTIPEGIAHIGEWAFYGCERLASVTIPKGVTSIGDSAFRRSGLTSVIVPESVASIGMCAFHDCKDLVSVTIPASVTHIGKNAFYQLNISKPLTLSVTRGSYAEQYAQENGIPYVYGAE